MNQLESRFLSARKNAILASFPGLNDMQREAVAATEGPLLVLAGAGSGKTTVLIRRTANLLRFGRGSDSSELPKEILPEDVAFLESCAEKPPVLPEDVRRMEKLCAIEPAQPWRVMAITFTNKAANELKERLAGALGEEKAQDVWAMTFHSACVRILRRDADCIGYGKDFTIYDTNDSQSAIKRILREMEMDEKSFPVRSVMTYISNAKGDLQGPDAFIKAAGNDYRRRKIGEVYETYTRRLQEANAMDFDDLLLLTVKLFESCPEVKEYYANRFRYVLVDEYQDTNKLQYLFVKALASVHGNICVVGDDDQSIYRFRGATIENILGFEREYPGCRTIRLEQNYRSTGMILAASNAVIRNNTGRKGKELWTAKEKGEKLQIYTAEDERDEAQYVAAKMLSGYSETHRWKDFAVLYRMNAQSNQLEYAMKRNSIPYRVVGGMKFFDRAEIKDVLSWLAIIARPEDSLRLVRAVNSPARGIGAKTVDTAQELAQRDSRSLWEVFCACREYPELQRASAKIGQFTELVNDLRELAKDTRVDELYDTLLDRSGYVRALEEKNTDEDRSRIENVRELRTNIVNYMEGTEDAALQGFLDEVALYTDLDEDSSADCVMLMTMHSAKGLEFPTVFVVGAEEGIFPGSRAIGDPEELEEERRLCYVAMTRAKERLFITNAKRRMLFGRTTPGTESRFVEEIPAEYAERRERRPAWASSSGQRVSENDFPRTDYRPSRPGAYAAPKKRFDPAASAASASPAAKAAPCPLKIGDRVRHRAFGEGRVTGLKPAGQDTLVVVEFDTAGSKRMMLRFAMQFMEIL